MVRSDSARDIAAAIWSSWRLRLDQDMVAHLDQRGDLAGAEHLAGDHVDARRPRRCRAGSCRSSAWSDRRSTATRRSACPSRRRSGSTRWSPTSCAPARVKTLIWLWPPSTTLMSISSRELVDIVVALVAQRRGGGVLDVGQAELLVDVGDLTHRVVRLVDRIGDASSASLRSAWMSAVMPLRCCASVCAGGEHAVARRARVRRGGERLRRGGEIVEHGFERVALARLAEDALQPLRRSWRAASHRRRRRSRCAAGAAGTGRARG